MAKDKERSANPAQQQRKLEKAKALRKGKAEAQARRNEKLARRNPDRLQRQVDDLKALEESGQIKPREKQILEQLEREVKAIRKAHESLGNRAPQFSNHTSHTVRGDRDETILGKRRWDGKIKQQTRQQESSGSETDESVRKIPMPKGTPPPIPGHWHRNQRRVAAAPAQLIEGELKVHGIPQKPEFVQAKTTYESAPQIRDLRKEAVSRFLPNVVRQKQAAVRGAGSRLVEPEEVDKLEKEGYVNSTDPRDVRTEQGLSANEDKGDAVYMIRLADEERRFRQEMMQATVEDDEES